MKVQRSKSQKTTNGGQRDGGGESTQRIIFEIAIKKPNTVCSFLKVLYSSSSTNMLCAISIASLSQLSKFTSANFPIKMELTKRGEKMTLSNVIFKPWNECGFRHKPSDT